MSPAEKPAESSPAADESVEDRLSRTPDEDGPHDVPDDKVIEKTLPSVPISDKVGGKSR
jgi:hypothetical protein